MTTKTADITPDKSLFEKLGKSGYRTEQAVSELVDNAIDARVDGSVRIDVVLDFEKRAIVVSDNGSGMGFEELRDGLTIAKTTKDGTGLGRFGLGMKSACSALGKAFEVTTARQDTKAEYSASYDQDAWLNEQSASWDRFPIKESAKPMPWHGTRIRISRINVPLYHNQTTAFKRSFGIRYGAYLESGQVRLYVNGSACTATKVAVEDESRKELVVETPSGNFVRGWIGLLEKRSVKGDYGMHLYKNSRLVKAYAKFGIRSHPEASRVVGELNLDHVPVNFHKTGFLEDAPEYKEAVWCFERDQAVVDTVKSSASKAPPPESVQAVLEYAVRGGRGGSIRPRLRAPDARILLQKAETVRVQDGERTVDFVFGDEGSLYSIQNSKDVIQVSINRKSPLFRIVGNPLFLLGMVGLEAKHVQDKSGQYADFLSARNASWSEFIQEWLVTSKDGSKKRTEKTSPEYGLAKNLLSLYDHLERRFAPKFQFTGLSTLAPYLHNAYDRIVYSIEVERGAAQYLADVIDEFDRDRFVAIPKPKASDVNAVLEFSENTDLVIVRESSKAHPSVAPPEKAWADLFSEFKKGVIPISENEIAEILEQMEERKIVDSARLHSLIKSRHMPKDITSMYERPY